MARSASRGDPVRQGMLARSVLAREQGQSTMGRWEASVLAGLLIVASGCFNRTERWGDGPDTDAPVDAATTTGAPTMGGSTTGDNGVGTLSGGTSTTGESSTTTGG